MNFGDPRLPQRFWDGCIPEPNSGCWLWLRSLNGPGYGGTSVYGVTSSSHRLAYIHLVGPVPDGLELDHKCGVRSCCNPTRLEPVTHLENVRRGRGGEHLRIRTHCPKGHPYDEVNTNTQGGSRRSCRECGRIATRAWYHERGGAARQAARKAERKASRAA